jgi:CRP/FNR family transcriptional regulator, cyclic AMP receptor protein
MQSLIRHASVASRRSANGVNVAHPTFDLKLFLDSAGLGRALKQFRQKEIVFSQGDPAGSVIYIQRGGVRVSVLNETGREAVVALLGPGDFVGEGCLTGLPFRMATAMTMAPTEVLIIEKQEMVRVLHVEHAFSDRFVSFMLSRNHRVEEDLVDQLFNSVEKRLARALLLLARYGKPGPTRKILHKVSQGTLAEMVGATRSRVNFFMNKFRRMGFIQYNGEIQVNDSLLAVVLEDHAGSLAKPA